MTPLAFFRTPEVRRLLARAAQAAGMPLSLHYVEHGEEGPKIAAWGVCAACAYVAALPEGRNRCRESRLAASVTALGQQRALPYLCHMGFGCVVLPALEQEHYVLTFGPYMPKDHAEGMEYDALRGLRKLTGQAQQHFPVPLSDIHHAPVAAVPALAEWTAENLNSLWRIVLESEAAENAKLSDEADSGAAETPARKSRKRPDAPQRDIYAAAAIASAVAAGDQPGAREQLAGVLAEIQAQPRRRVFVQRGRIVAAVGAALEALENTGVDTAPGWQGFPGLVAAVQAAEDARAMLDAAMLVLGPLRRAAAKAAAPAMNYDALNAIIQERLYEGVTLEEAAGLLGESATTISHRLRRKFGMSYSEYLGRLRIGKAKELLRRTQMSATQVGERVGMRDQSNFTKLFKKFEGMSPLEYRQQFGKRK